jgi:chromate reductase
MTYTVGYMIGSLSAVSINRILTRALVRLAPPEWRMVEIPISDLPLYNRDLDSDYPPEARALKDAIADVDAMLFVTPEYNRDIPGALKNAIDWASRPWGQIRLHASRPPLTAPLRARSAPRSRSKICAAF